MGGSRIPAASGSQLSRPTRGGSGGGPCRAAPGWLRGRDQTPSGSLGPPCPAPPAALRPAAPQAPPAVRSPSRAPGRAPRAGARAPRRRGPGRPRGTQPSARRLRSGRSPCALSPRGGADPEWARRGADRRFPSPKGEAPQSSDALREKPAESLGAALSWGRVRREREPEAAPRNARGPQSGGEFWRAPHWSRLVWVKLSAQWVSCYIGHQVPAAQPPGLPQGAAGRGWRARWGRGFPESPLQGRGGIRNEN